jgi:predicted chitinase
MKDPNSKANMDKMIELIKANKAQELPPILVRKYKDGYQVLDGHHRFHAYKAAGAKTIPGKIVPDSDIKIIDQVKEDANLDLAQALEKTQATSYDAIDSLMKKIAKQHNITAKELHDLWMKKYDQTPDDWIKAKLNEVEEKKWLIRNSYNFVLNRFTAPSYKEAEAIADQWASDNIERFGKSKRYILSKDKKSDDERFSDLNLRLNPIEEGPIWDKVKKTAAAGAIAGAAGYGALTGQFAKDEPARAPTEITIPGGDLEQQKPAVKKEKEKLTPSTATNADPKMEQLVFVTALRSGIKGKELAQFMAQVAHETLGFQRLVEVGSKEYFNRYDPEHNPKKAKILGNVKKGDGLRYKGRGFIQITGRDNYNRAGQALGIDLVNNPKLASTPDVAAKIAVWYWKSRVKPAVDDYTDTIGVTSKVNPSMNGLGDRDMNFHHYLQRLQLED